MYSKIPTPQSSQGRPSLYYAPLRQYSSPPGFHLHTLYPGRPMPNVKDRRYIPHEQPEAAAFEFNRGVATRREYAKWLMDRTMKDSRDLGIAKGVDPKDNKIPFHPAVIPDDLNDDPDLRYATLEYPNSNTMVVSGQNSKWTR